MQFAFPFEVSLGLELQSEAPGWWQEGEPSVAPALPTHLQPWAVPAPGALPAWDGLGCGQMSARTCNGVTRLLSLVAEAWAKSSRARGEDVVFIHRAHSKNPSGPGTGFPQPQENLLPWKREAR